jgi:hypothetical protein
VEQFCFLVPFLNATAGYTLAKEVGAVHIALASSSFRQTSALAVPLFFISTSPYNTLVLYNHRYPSYDWSILDKQQSKWVTAIDTNICVASFSLGCNISHIGTPDLALYQEVWHDQPFHHFDQSTKE